MLTDTRCLITLTPFLGETRNNWLRIFLFYSFNPKIKVPYRTFRKNIEKTSAQLLEDAKEEFPDAFQRKVSDHFRIVCFADNLVSVLMWGHYTARHFGFAIGFDPHHPLFATPDFASVTYVTERPVVTETSHSQILWNKSPEWKYEGEWRLIKRKEELVLGTYNRNGTQTEGYFLPLPMDSIKAVYFGCRISAEDRNRILNALDAFPSVERFFMQRHRIAYSLDPVPWAQWKEPKGLANEIFKREWPTGIK